MKTFNDYHFKDVADPFCVGFTTIGIVFNLDCGERAVFTLRPPDLIMARQIFGSVCLVLLLTVLNSSAHDTSDTRGL